MVVLVVMVGMMVVVVVMLVVVVVVVVVVMMMIIMIIIIIASTILVAGELAISYYPLIHACTYPRIHACRVYYRTPQRRTTSIYWVVGSSIPSRVLLHVSGEMSVSE